MDTKQLIENLSSDCPPVHVLKPPLYRFMGWIIFLALYYAGLLFAFGGISGFQMLLTPGFILEFLGLLLLLLIAGFAAFCMSIPGSRLNRWAYGLLIPLYLWFGYHGLGYIRDIRADSSSMLDTHLFCGKFILFSSIVPAVLLGIMIRKGFAVRYRFVGFLVGLVPAVFAAFYLHSQCKLYAHNHVMLWHVLPVVLIAFLGMFLGKILLKRY